MDEGKAGYNFAFYMILFITIFTGGYYAYGKIKDKFFPQSTVSDYVKKKWRYWDDRRSQVYTKRGAKINVSMLFSKREALSEDKKLDFIGKQNKSAYRKCFIRKRLWKRPFHFDSESG